MKRSRIVWPIAVILLLAVLLVLFLPARWLLPLLQPRLHGLRIEGVHGLLWDGGAARLRGLDGRPLGRLHWTLSRSLLWGRLDLRLDLAGPRLTAAGRLQRDGEGRQVWTDVSLQAGLAGWAPRLDSSLGTPQGSVAVNLRRAVLQANWPIELDGQVRWRNAAMQTRTGKVALGDFEMQLAGANGVLNGHLSDLPGGPLRAEGRWQASPLGWRLDLRLAPRGADPALRQWLARLGPASANGTIELHRRGGLAAASP